MFGMKGVGDMMKLLGNREQLMAKVEESKVRARNRTVVGDAGAGMVKVTANGIGEIVNVEFDPEAIKDSEALGALVVAATNVALAKAREVLMQETQSAIGIEMPPGMSI